MYNNTIPKLWDGIPYLQQKQYLNCRFDDLPDDIKNILKNNKAIRETELQNVIN